MLISDVWLRCSLRQNPTFLYFPSCFADAVPLPCSATLQKAEGSTSPWLQSAELI